MASVTVSPKCQVVIMRAVRESMGLRPGQKLQVFEHEGRIELITERTASESRGVLFGTDTGFAREGDRP